MVKVTADFSPAGSFPELNTYTNAVKTNPGIGESGADDVTRRSAPFLCASTVLSAPAGAVVVGPPAGTVELGSVGIVVVGESTAVVDVDSSGLDAYAGRADVAAIVKALNSATPLRMK
jgi:hypothetical protein